MLTRAPASRKTRAKARSIGAARTRRCPEVGHAAGDLGAGQGRRRSCIGPGRGRGGGAAAVAAGCGNGGVVEGVFWGCGGLGEGNGRVRASL